MKKALWSGFVAGLVMLVVGFSLGQLVNWIFPSLQAEYVNANLFRPWSDPLMSLYFLHPILLGLILGGVWQKVKMVVLGEGVKRAWSLAWPLWLLLSIPGMLITYSSFVVSLGMVLSWTIVGLVQYFFGAWVLVKMNK